MYKLLIEDKNGVWKVADLGDDKPAMNYQTNTISELKNRQVNYSQALKLPPTPNNCMIFGMSDNFDVVTDFPYTKHNCRLFSHDSVLAGPGSYLILDKITKYLEVQILSGNADFFTLLNQPMSNLDLGSLIRNLASFNPSNFSPYYEYAAATFTKVAETFYRTDLDDMFPFIYLKSAIEKLVSQNGYVLQTNLTDAQWNKKAISLCSLIPSADSFTVFDGQAGYTTTYIGAQYIPFAIVPGSTDILTNYTDSGTGESGLKWIAPINCTVKVVIAGTTNDAYDFILKVYNQTTGADIYDYTGLTHSEEMYVTLSKGDELRMWARKYVTTSGKTHSFSVAISEMVADEVPLKGRLHFAPNLGFDTQIDFFKMFVQLFGLTVDITEADPITNTYDYWGAWDSVTAYTTGMAVHYYSDYWVALSNNTNHYPTDPVYWKKLTGVISIVGSTLHEDFGALKIVRAYTMKKLYDNKAFAKDWSNKIQDIPVEQSFVLSGYAQNNFIRFEDNTSDNVSDYGVITIPNETLETDKDLFSLKLEAGYDRKVLNWIVANIPLNEISTDGLITTFKGGKPHIVELSNDTIEFTIYGSTFFYHKATHVKVQSLIDTFYPELITMLLAVKYGIYYFNLLDEDIETFDQFIPSFIQKYGAYFYVNKINNYITGLLTKVELIKL